MTPNDIVGMAVLNELDLIAITDHNTIANVRPVIEAAQTVRENHNRDLLVLPGIEVTTAEEVHVLCLFSDIESAQEFETELAYFYSTLANREDIFGNQLLFDSKDNITGSMERMLMAPTLISFDHLYHLISKRNAAFIPAHIERNSFSVSSNLGFLPPHLEINTIELNDESKADLYTDKKILYSSDAHQIWAINERKHFLLLPELTAVAAIEYLK